MEGLGGTQLQPAGAGEWAGGQGMRWMLQDTQAVVTSDLNKKNMAVCKTMLDLSSFVLVLILCIYINIASVLTGSN